MLACNGRAPVQDEPDLPEGNDHSDIDDYLDCLRSDSSEEDYVCSLISASPFCLATTILTLTAVQPSSSRTWHARIQTDDYAGRRNTSVGLFGKLQRVMHCQKEKGLSKSPNEGRKPELHILSWECIASLMNANPWLLYTYYDLTIPISSDTKILGQSNGNKKKDIVMEKQVTTEAEISCHIDEVAVVSQQVVPPNGEPNN
ncbi:hypothetical protein Tco_1064456 [Tanacetum coccineum]